jgi:hypothetical protein
MRSTTRAADFYKRNPATVAGGGVRSFQSLFVLLPASRDHQLWLVQASDSCS